MIFNTSTITAYEKALIKGAKSLFIVVRSSLTLNSIDFTSAYTAKKDSNLMVLPVYLQDKQIKLMNSYIDVEGTILVSSDPLDLHLENLELNLTKSSGGFDIDIVCNYPEAFHDGLIYINNFWHYFSESRKGQPYSNQMFRYYGMAKVNSSNAVIEGYTNNREFRSPFTFMVKGNCVPDYDERHWDFKNTTLRMKGSESDYNMLALGGVSDMYVKNIVTIDGLNIDIVGSFLSPVYATGSSINEMYMSDVKIVNSSLTLAFLNVVSYDKVIMNNIHIESSKLLGTYYMGITSFNKYSISNLTMQNFTSSGSTYTSIVQLRALPNASASLSGWNISNSNIGKHSMVYMNTATAGSITVENFHFANTILGVGSYVIWTGTVDNFQLSNSTFTNIMRQDENDDTSSIINIESIKLVEKGEYVLQNISVVNSAITFFKMNTLDSADIEGKSFEMSSILFTDIYSQYKLDLILIENLETTSDFGIVLNGIEASNITFDSIGSLLSLHQQTVTPLIIKDCYFHDLIGVQIYIESFNLANKQLLTSVEMVNITATSINSGTSSFILSNEGAKLEIFDSVFTNMENTEGGAVITGGYQNSRTSFYNSTFMNNTSIYGGVANVHSGSVIKFYECELTNNFAIQSGAIQASDDGFFELHD